MIYFVIIMLFTEATDSLTSILMFNFGEQLFISLLLTAMREMNYSFK